MGNRVQYKPCSTKLFDNCYVSGDLVSITSKQTNYVTSGQI